VCEVVAWVLLASCMHLRHGAWSCRVWPSVKCMSSDGKALCSHDRRGCSFSVLLLSTAVCPFCVSCRVRHVRAAGQRFLVADALHQGTVLFVGLQQGPAAQLLALAAECAAAVGGRQVRARVCNVRFVIAGHRCCAVSG
jgi:hypothetical protein